MPRNSCERNPWRGRGVAGCARRSFHAFVVAAASASPTALAAAVSQVSLRARAGASTQDLAQHGGVLQNSGRLARHGFATDTFISSMSRHQVEHLPQCATFSASADDLIGLRERALERLPGAGDPAFGYPGETDGKGWRTAAQEAGSGARNLCVGGRLLPELYVLGAAKAATTSLAADLLGTGMEVAERDCRSRRDPCNGWVNTTRLSAHVKEFHFFDFAMDWLDASDEAMARQRNKWLSTLPRCDARQGQAGTRRVMADFTPDNLRLVPLPVGVEPDGYFQGTFREWQMKRGAVARAANPEREINLPLALRSVFYKESFNRLNMVVMLREPAERMQSHWYCCICPDGDCRRSPYGSFSNDMREVLVTAQSSPAVINDWLWYSLYGKHLEEWLTHFDPEQFVFVPYREYVLGDKDRLCKELSRRLRFAMDCESDKAEATWIGRKDAHPRVKDDLHPSVYKAFQDFIEPENKRLVQLLAWSHTRGASLVNFDTVVYGDKDAVHEWLEKGW